MFNAIFKGEKYKPKLQSRTLITLLAWRNGASRLAIYRFLLPVVMGRLEIEKGFFDQKCRGKS